MPSKRLICLLLAALGVNGVARAADLMTLFTTPEERQIINSNRYKSDEIKPEVQVQQQPVELPIQQLVKEEVTREYMISGITISSEGPHTVWINSTMYEDGQRLDDNSRIKVMAGDEVRIRITAPDGKHYFATSGEKLLVTYLAPVED